jgi:hypothetical protein
LAAWLAALLWPALAGSEPGLSIDLSEPRATRSERHVSEARWAAELSHELGLARLLPVEPTPEENFALLCGDRAERSLAAGGRRVAEQGAFRVAREAPRPRAAGEPLRLVLQLPATALYQLRVEGVGLQRWVVDGRPIAHLDRTPLGGAQAPGVLPPTQGAHVVSAYLSRGARVERMELSVFRSLCVAPADGWRAERALSHGAMARTLVRAFDFDRRLPERSEEIFVVEGERFDTVTAGGDRTSRKLTMASQGDGWAEAVDGPAEFTWEFGLEAPRIVSIEARTHGLMPQIWAVDGRYRVTLHPEAVDGGFAWNHVLTLPLGSGRHALRALVSRGSGVDAVRFVPHLSGDRDYVRVLEGLGFEGGPPSAPVAGFAALSVLESGSFAELAGGFRMRMAGSAWDRPLVLVDSESKPFTSRPLAPLLPAEL